MWLQEDCAGPGTARGGKARDLVAAFDSAVAPDDTATPAYRSRSKRSFRRMLQSSSRPSWRNFLATRIKTITNGFLLTHPPLPPRVTTGPYRPRADLHIFVSDAYPKSKALVPAWLGQRGWMEFPAHRVVAGHASIAHELVHVLFPSGNRMLYEGLAVYLQYKLFPKIPVYPNFGDRLETLVADFLRANYKNSPHRALWDMDLEGLEKISTPDKLSLRIGRDPRSSGQRREIPTLRLTR